MNGANRTARTVIALIPPMNNTATPERAAAFGNDVPTLFIRTRGRRAQGSRMVERMPPLASRVVRTNGEQV